MTNKKYNKTKLNFKNIYILTNLFSVKLFIIFNQNNKITFLILFLLFPILLIFVKMKYILRFFCHKFLINITQK